MVKLKVSLERALQLLGWVKHETFQEAIEEHWFVDPDGTVKAQSVLWLFCWGKTGQASADVAHHVHRIFNEILDTPFETVDSKVDHEWAQEMRYAPGDITQDMEEKLNGAQISAVQHGAS